jgi:MFS family permease
MEANKNRKLAFVFLIFLGFISLLSDFTHEGARSIYGTYLGLIGVSAFLVSFIAGLGEFVGQALRVVTGIITDKTKRYWLMMILGYALNLLAIPLLMFVDASIWQVALVLIILERVGKAIRAPAKSALISFTTPHLGVGKAFAFQEALDQLGAFLGPLFVFAVLSLHQGSELDGYQLAFGLLGIFAIMTIVLLVIARSKYRHPDQMENTKTMVPLKGNRSFVIYMLAVVFLALGFIDYPVLAFHIGELSIIDVTYVPLLYALAMGVDALAALAFGYLFDKKGIISLLIAIGVAALVPATFFLLDGLVGIIVGIVLWGIAMGAQESILKAVVASFVSKEKRATAYGIFYAAFGTAWFLGSLLIGIFYEIDIWYVVIFATLMELASLLTISVYGKKFNEVIHQAKMID